MRVLPYRSWLNSSLKIQEIYILHGFNMGSRLGISQSSSPAIMSSIGPISVYPHVCKSKTRCSNHLPQNCTKTQRSEHLENGLLRVSVSGFPCQNAEPECTGGGACTGQATKEACTGGGNPNSSLCSATTYR